MEEKKLVVVDTDVLIEFLDRNNYKVKARLLEIGIENVCLSEVTATELFFGAREKAHLQTLKKFIDNCTVFSVTSEISNLHLKLVRDYSLSHKLRVPDSLIAATAITLNLELYSLNTKDFNFIKGLRLL